ncbi:hypothetical protein EG329_010723 [Mollisiaceae sp. DMI_Dod_QoI]|nr:hypothetical protein EG329_010723 [Helotiales sp. DMI_Dod_QoI]
MSSIFNAASTSVDALRSREFDDSLGLNHHYLPTTPFDNHNPSPFNHSQTLSNSASPSYTPGESEYSDYQPSELPEPEDPFFGVDFDAGVPRVDSIPQAAILGNIAYPASGLNRPLSDLPASTEDKPTSATSTHYPLSPVHSNVSNTPSPRVVPNDIKGKTTISQHELTTDLHNSRFPNFNPLVSTQSASIQLTPDNSGSSHTSAEDFEPSALAYSEDSPSVMASNWSNVPQHGQSSNFAQSSGQYVGTNSKDFGEQFPIQASEPVVKVQISHDEYGIWRSNETGRGGLDPDDRKELDEPVETLNEQQERLRIANKNREIEDWTSQTGGTSDLGNEQPSQSFLPANNPDLQQGPAIDRRTPAEEEDNITPLDDGVSIHENRLIEGQLYFDFNDTNVSEVGRKLLMDQAPHWDDAPAFPYTTETEFQPRTANEAIMRFNKHSDSMSIASRAATWGTRRRSVPSFADIEGIVDGSFIKKLAITKSKEETRPRQNSLFDGLVGALSRRGSHSRLKRTRSTQNIPEEAEEQPHPRQNSQGSLLVPKRTLSFGRKPPPSIDNALAAMAGPLAAVGGNTHARNNSVSGGAQSPKSPHLGFPRSIMGRSRSKSDFSQDRNPQSGLVGLLRNHGGPPVANLAHGSNSAQPEAKKPVAPQAELPDHDDEEEDDDEQIDDVDMKVDSDQQAESIVPNYEGFKAHVRRLNPEMESKFNWLVSRIAHQQEIRYKNLLDLRVKHLQHVNARDCSAGHHCLALGGTITLRDAKGNPREPAAGGLQLVTDFSDNDSNPGEGALTEETFPQGVPMPPARNLPAEFECQLCFKAKKFQKPSDWTKHVHEDVQPFTCTYEKCKEPKSFKRKADWVRHENERHRHLEWWICQVDDCRHPCYRKDNFLQHLVREHKLPEPKQKTKAAIKKARLTEPAWMMLEKCHHETMNRPQDEPCKFCGKQFPTWKKLTVHLAKHMEHISLPILRLVEARTVDATTIISPVEQILTPVTPGSGIPKSEFSPSPPFTIHSNPPHVQNPYVSRPFDQPAYFGTSGPIPSYGVQAPMPQDVHYNHNSMYQNYAVQPMTQSRGFSSMESNGLGPGDHGGVFGMSSGYTQPKIEPQAFDSMHTGFTNPIPNQNYNVHPVSGFSMPQTFSTAPAVSSFQTPTMMGVNPAYGFEAGQNFQQVSMSRAQGSESSYGHSPQHAPGYYQPQ